MSDNAKGLSDNTTTDKQRGCEGAATARAPTIRRTG